MAKGGRYLNTKKKEKKKGLRTFITVLVILGLLAIGGVLAFKLVMGSVLGNVNRAEYVEKNQDKSEDDLLSEIYGGMDLSGMVATPEEDEEGDVYVPDNIQAPEQAEESVPETGESVPETTPADE